MSHSMEQTAKLFFETCEAGKGWEACAPYCKPDATFSAQAEPLAGITTLAGYTEWVKGLAGPMPDGHYDLKSFAVDAERKMCRPTRCFSRPIRARVGRVLLQGKASQPTMCT